MTRKEREIEREKSDGATKLISRAREKYGTQSKTETRCLGTRQAYMVLPTLPRGNLIVSSSGNTLWV